MNEARLDTEVIPDLHQFTLEEVKIKINTLLWQVLPSDTTIGQADSIACAWFDIYDKAVGTE